MTGAQDPDATQQPQSSVPPPPNPFGSGPRGFPPTAPQYQPAPEEPLVTPPAKKSSMPILAAAAIAVIVIAVVLIVALT
jgi:hypothetical protein